MLNLYFLGPPRVEIDGTPVDIQRRRALALLIYLAVNGHMHSRDTLATLLFPETDQRRARAYLRRDLAALNANLPGDWIAADRDTVALQMDGDVWLDVEQFRRYLADCQAHDHPADELCAACLARLTEAAALYTDHFLAGFSLRDSAEFDDWQFFQAESLRQDHALILERLVKGLSAQSDYEAAIPHARQWVALDPLHEPAQQQLIQLYARTDQKAAALRQYEEYVRLLDEELGIPPEPETATLYEAIKAQRMVEPFLKAEGQRDRLRPESDEGGAEEEVEQSPPNPETSSAAEPPVTELTRYELMGEIGRGGFATVYRACDTHLERLVALKELKSHLLADTRWIKRFRQEAKLIARLNHPHIVTVYDVTQTEGRHFIVMALVAGESLAERLAEQGRMAWPQAIETLSAIAAGLDYAHRLGVLHRDLKPANILLDPEHGPLLSDFGLAKLMDENSFSQSREVVGTPFYIAPEVWDGESATLQTDIYALGCILYEMLTGQKLFAGETSPAVMRAHFQPLSLPERWPEDVPPGLADVLNKALAKQPAKRYETAGAFVAALTGLTAAQTASVNRPDAQSVLTLATQERNVGHYQAAIDLVTSLLPHAPTDESIHRELMRLYALAGHRHEALRQYRECVETLATELQTTPEAETEQLYQQIISGDALSTTALSQPAGLPPVPTLSEDGHAPLVGREEELDTIQAKIRPAHQGRGATLLLAGVSGVGKTRLAYEALRAITPSGVTVLVGAAYEQEGHLAYQPFIEAIDRYLSEQQRPTAQNPITHYQPMGAGDPQQEHSAMFKATATFLTGLTNGGPVILLIDDLHAADEASLSMFHYLARQTRSAPFILLATYRTDIPVSGVSPFGSLLNALYREQLSFVLTLAPLSATAGARIINHTLEGEAEPALVQAILDIAEGNPFYVQEISRAMLKAGRLVREEGQWRLPPGMSMQVPSELRDLLRERVCRLGSTVETTLTAAAVIGREFRFAVLRNVVDIADGDLFDALDEALDAHLLEETDSGYRFQHSLIRHTLYDSLSRRRRAWLHGHTAEAIESVYAHQPDGLLAQIEALAYHYDLSDQRDKALPYLIQASKKAQSVFALEVANDYLERALVLMDEVGVTDTAQRWKILKRLGMMATTMADTSRAVTRFEQALALVTPVGIQAANGTWQPTLSDQVRVHRYASRALITAGQVAGAERYLQTAMEFISDTAPASLDYANLLYDVALWHWHNNEYQAAFEAAQRSLDIAEQLDDVQARAQAYEMLALACHSLGEWQQGLNFEEQRSVLVGPNLDVTDAFDIHL